MTDAVVIPDSIEPYLGYKALNVEADGSLYSPSRSTPWPIGERLEGQCTAQLSHWTWVPVEGEPRSVDDTVSVTQGQMTFATASSAAGPVRTFRQPSKPSNPLPPGWNWSWEPLTHAIPDENCQCGIYVAADPEGCLSYLGPNGVIVQIALWGKVIPAHSGARGQYAYPQRLLVPNLIAPQIAPVAEAYGVPMDILDAEDPVPPEPKTQAVKPGDVLNVAIQANSENAQAELLQAMEQALKDMP